MNDVSWIAVDWGTSNLRLWGMTRQNAVIFALEAPRGMNTLSQEQYSDVLLELLAPQIQDITAPLPVIVCGMAGARQGWREAPYAELPAGFDHLASAAVAPPMPQGILKPLIIPGLCKRAEGHEDVMRGEETQLAGLMALMPDFEGIVCMPGTHSKWARISQGKVVDFSTAMTGELYELMRTHSVLRHSLQGDIAGPHLEEGITDGLEASLTTPGRLTALLFRTRSASLLSGKSADWCAGYLSGLLVGTEVAAFRDWRTETGVVLLGSDRLMRLYGSALSNDGAASTKVDATSATLAGLAAIKDQISSG